MQKNVKTGVSEIKSSLKNSVLKSDLLQKPFIKEAFGVTSPFAVQADNLISQKQIQILEDAIKRYEKLEDIRKFTNLALEEIETVTEEDIKRALEIEQMVSIEDDKAVLGLLQNEGFLHDLSSMDFSKILNRKPPKNNPFALPDDDSYFDDFDI